MVFIGVGGTIDGQVNPVLSAAEGQVVQITLINGEGAEHDIVFADQEATARSPHITGKGASTNIAFRAGKAGDYHLFLQPAGPSTRRHAGAIPGHAAAAGADAGRGRHFAKLRPICRRRSASGDRKPSASI